MTVDINEIKKDIENGSVDPCASDIVGYGNKDETTISTQTDEDYIPSTNEFEKNHSELMRTAKFEWQISKDYGQFEVILSNICLIHLSFVYIVQSEQWFIYY